MFYLKFSILITFWIQALSDQKTEVKNVKEAMIPAELGQTMDTIKKHIKVLDDNIFVPHPKAIHIFLIIDTGFFCILHFFSLFFFLTT